jgi:hypothetical protein
MAVSATSAALQGASSYSTKWHQKRIHRKLDDRDDVIDEALEIIEDFDTAIYPYIAKITGATNYNSVGQTGGEAALTIEIGGKGCTSADTITVVFGTESIAADKINKSVANTLTVTISDMGDWGSGDVPTAGDSVPLYIRINNVLLPVVSVTTKA